MIHRDLIERLADPDPVVGLAAQAALGNILGHAEDNEEKGTLSFVLFHSPQSIHPLFVTLQTRGCVPCW
jgi:hypothetical protein